MKTLAFRSADEVSVGDELLAEDNDKMTPTKVNSVSIFSEQSDNGSILFRTHIINFTFIFSRAVALLFN